MNSAKIQKYRILAVLAFSVACLEAVNMLTFVWLTAVKYKGNIRGYVPAGFQGLTVLTIATIILLTYLGTLKHKLRDKSVGYFLSGIIAAPISLFLFSVYSNIFIGVLSYSLKKDVVFNSGGAILFTLLAIKIHKSFLNKKTSHPDPLTNLEASFHSNNADHNSC